MLDNTYAPYGNENTIPPKVSTLFIPKNIDVENKYNAITEAYDAILTMLTLNILQSVNGRMYYIYIKQCF